MIHLGSGLNLFMQVEFWLGLDIVQSAQTRVMNTPIINLSFKILSLVKLVKSFMERATPCGCNKFNGAH